MNTVKIIKESGSFKSGMKQGLGEIFILIFVYPIVSAIWNYLKKKMFEDD